MARLARIVIPGLPHLITQRGNRGQDVFFEESDAAAYVSLMAEQCARFGVEIWAYCLMKNRVHMLAVPEEETSLRHALGEAHRRYTNRINERENWAGHLWQSRFSSFPMDENYILPAAHFIEMTPVMAGLSKTADIFRWSSAKAHIKGTDDELCSTAPLLERAPDWNAFLQKGININRMQTITNHISTGRPLGNKDFIENLESQTGRTLQKQKPGRKKKAVANDRRQRLLVPDAPRSTTQITEQDLAALIDGGSKNIS